MTFAQPQAHPPSLAPQRGSPALAWAAVALAFLAGNTGQLQQAQLLPKPVLLGGAAAAMLVLLFCAWARRRRGRASLAPHRAVLGERWALLALAMAVAVLAFVATSLRASLRLAQQVPAALQGQDVQVSGRVVSVPRETLSGSRFVFEIDQASHRGQAVVLPQRVSLGWYRGFDDDALLGGPPEAVRAGQRWQFTVRLKPPHGSFNPHGFDLELWLFEQNIRASGQVRVRADMPALKLQEKDGLWLQRLRQQVRDQIGLRVADPALAGVLAALCMGDQAAIERDDWALFRTTGVAHLMSISGLHVTMLAWLAAAILGRLWRRSPRAMQWLPAPQAARWGALLVAFLYALFAGWGVPAQRTVCMLAVVAALRSSGRRWPLHAVLLAAAVAVVLFDPWALLQPGFWLSFAAVGLLVASEPVHAADDLAQQTQDSQLDASAGWLSRGRVRGLSLLRTGLRTQLVATIGLAPLSMLFFQQVSVVGLLANLVAIPVVTLVITPLALLGLVVPPLWALAAALVQVLTAFLQVLASWPWAVWSAASAPPWAVASGLLAALLAVLPLPWRLRVLALPLMLPLLAPPVARPPHGQFEMVAADVGQGTALLVRTRSHLLVYDAGPSYSRESDAAMRVLLPLLRGRGENQVDLLMLSHRDADHVGGAATLLAAVPVRALSSSLASDHPLLALGVPHQGCQAGQTWTWDGVQFEVFHPQPSDLGRALKPNALSCVLKVRASVSARPGHAPSSVLLTGDIEAAQEAALVARAGAALRSQVLLVPHHGSRTSSTAALLDAVQPQQAIVQAGFLSRFGHPAPEVLARYSQAGVEVQRSDRCGAWTLAADGSSFCERHRAQRYWHHAAQSVAVVSAVVR